MAASRWRFALAAARPPVGRVSMHTAHFSVACRLAIGKWNAVAGRHRQGSVGVPPNTVNLRSFYPQIHADLHRLFKAVRGGLWGIITKIIRKCLTQRVGRMKRIRKPAERIRIPDLQKIAGSLDCRSHRTMAW